MKMLSLIAILVVLVGCDNYRKMTPQEIAERDEARKREEYEKHVNDIKSRIEIIEYNSHSYVVYNKYHPVWGHNGVNVVSMTHNPDCRCLKK